jgi:hypothetical protein
MFGKLAIILAWMLTPAHAQLHLITGSPMPNFPTKFAAGLLQVRDDGTLRSLAALAQGCPKKVCGPEDGGASWITASYDGGIALVLSDRIVVLDLRKAAAVKTCAPPPGLPGSSWLHQWLLDTPSSGPVFALGFYDPEQRRSSLVGLRTDPSTPCDKSVVALDPIDLRYIAALGRSGIGSIGIWDGINLGVGVDARGDVTNRFGGASVPYGYEVPSVDLEGLKPLHSGIAMNNSEIMVLSLSENASNSRVLVFRKKDQVWRRVPLPAQRVLDPNAPPPSPPMRAFGHFIAMAEVQPRNAQNLQSAGSSEWRRGPSKTGPDVALLINDYRDVFPGRLHLYDVDSERSYTIDTNQGDSEILLVENGTIYYRASDRLYSAPITETGIGRPRLLATDDAIRDAHWAFTKH